VPFLPLLVDQADVIELLLEAGADATAEGNRAILEAAEYGKACIKGSS
jgi:hypothetical protein